ncbi:MAG: sterol desaturase family protein [Pseudomonadota bacterium]
MLTSETVEYWLYDLAEGWSGLALVGTLVALFVIECVRMYLRRGLTTEWWAETASSMATQIQLYFSEILVFTMSIVVYYTLSWYVTPFHLPLDWWTVILALIVADFTYYWEHRKSHEIRLLWCAHAVHHSSPVYNTATAFRFSIFDPVIAAVFHIPMILMGFDPILVFFSEVVVLAYQGWIHTEAIGKLGPLERVLNTPSHHRVHHGSDEKYLDRNYGGILIIWDRMFGTFAEEQERPTYGLVKQINTQNPIKVWFGELWALGRDVASARSAGEAWRIMTRPPGWKPED